MFGAIIGDIVGSRFEWRNVKTKDFPLFQSSCRPTDDSVMTLAVARAVMDCRDDYSLLASCAVRRMREYGNLYPHAGYGGRFMEWLLSSDPKPYYSYGNGAAMRVSACGFAARTEEEAKRFAREVTKVTHDHPEGLKAAEAVALAIYHARKGMKKEAIERFIKDNYYPIDFKLSDIRDDYDFDVSCQGSVPQAFESFFEANDYEDAIRNAVSIGGDSDTIAAITGGIAEAYFGIPETICAQAWQFLDPTRRQTIRLFRSWVFDRNFTIDSI